MTTSMEVGLRIAFLLCCLPFDYFLFGIYYSCKCSYCTEEDPHVHQQSKACEYECPVPVKGICLSIWRHSKAGLFGFNCPSLTLTSLLNSLLNSSLVPPCLTLTLTLKQTSVNVNYVNMHNDVLIKLDNIYGTIYMLTTIILYRGRGVIYFYIIRITLSMLFTS